MRKAADFLNSLAGILLGLYLTALFFLPHQPKLLHVPNTITNSYWLWFIALLFGAALLVLNGIITKEDIENGGLRRNLKITTDEGESIMSVSALEKQLLAELEVAADIINPRVFLRVKGEGIPISCRLRFELLQQDDVMTRVDALKKAVRDAFFRLIPSGANIEITADIQDLRSADTPKVSVPGGNEFSGPVYPVNGDSEEELGE